MEIYIYRYGYLGRKLAQLRKQGGDLPFPLEMIPPPPSSSPVFGTTLSGHDISLSGSMNMDYDTYMKSRPPESPPPTASERTISSAVKPGKAEVKYCTFISLNGLIGQLIPA